MLKIAKSKINVNPAQWKIGGKIVGVILIIVILAVTALTVFNYVTLSNKVPESKGQFLADYGENSLQRAVDNVIAGVDTLQTLALSPSIIEAVEAANQTYAGQDQTELEAEIARLDQAWRNGDPGVESLVSQIAGNQVSAHLRSFIQAFPEEVEVFVTDIQGLNIGMTERTGDYWQADEAWWQGAYAGGQGKTFVSEVDYEWKKLLPPANR